MTWWRNCIRSMSLPSPWVREGIEAVIIKNFNSSFLKLKGEWGEEYAQNYLEWKLYRENLHIDGCNRSLLPLESMKFGIMKKRNRDTFWLAASSFEEFELIKFQHILLMKEIFVHQWIDLAWYHGDTERLWLLEDRIPKYLRWAATLSLLAWEQSWLNHGFLGWGVENSLEYVPPFQK